MQVNFTRVPNRILLALITLDLTKRQIKIICLVLRLTYGCHVPWAFYEKKYFRVAGLHRSAISAELNQLRELRVLDMDEDKKIVRVNPHTEDWQCSQNSNISPEVVTETITEMLSKQLKNVTKLRTLPSEKVDEIDDSEMAARSVKKIKKEIERKDREFFDMNKIHERIDWRMPH
jgi:phage replication O-like protein O